MMLEVVSKPLIGFKVKADARFEPEEYWCISRIRTERPTLRLDPRGGFETASKNFLSGTVVKHTSAQRI